MEPSDTQVSAEVEGAQRATGLHLVTPKVRRHSTRPRSVTLGIRAAVLLVLFGAYWLVAIKVNDVNKLPTPREIFDHYGTLITGQDLIGNFAISMSRAAKGFAIGTSVGLVLGTIAGLTAVGEEVVDAPMQILRTVPLAAMLSLFIIWFGLGDLPKLLLIALFCVFPVYINTTSALRNVDRKMVESARSFGLRGPRLLGDVIVPMALPGILTGLRLAGSLSVLALVIAEQINSNSGIGAMLINANSVFEYTTVFCIVVLYGTFGLLVDLFFRFIEHVALPWRRGVSVR